MIYASTLTNLYIKRGIIDGCAANIALTVFQGTQPSAAAITSSWSSASANYLQHWTGAYWTQPNSNTVGNGGACQMGTVVAQNAYATGTATWGIIWGSNVSEANIQSATLPNANFIVGPVSTATGNGMIIMNTTSTTAGSNASTVTTAAISVSV